MRIPMMTCAAALAIAAPASGPAKGQSPPAAGPGQPAGPSTSAPAAPRFTLDTPVETLEADPGARAVLERDIPELVTRLPDQFKSWSLRRIQPESSGHITDEMMARVQADLAALH